MTISLKHTFASAKSDGTDSTLVQPSNWNAEHTITLAAGKVLGRDTSAAGAMQELPLAFDSSGNATVSATGSFTPPVGTTGQRPATGVTGMFRFNSTTTSFEGYNGTTWGSIGGTGTVTSVAVAGGTTGLTTSGGPITGSGTITLSGTLAAANGGTGLAAPGTSGNVLTSTGSAWASTAPTSSVATGTVIQYGSATAPSGFLLCDGATYTKSSYTALSTVLGSLPISYAQYYSSGGATRNYLVNGNLVGHGGFSNYSGTTEFYVSTNQGATYSMVQHGSGGVNYFAPRGDTGGVGNVSATAHYSGAIVWTGTNYVALPAVGNDCCGTYRYNIIGGICYTTNLTQTTGWTGVYAGNNFYGAALASNGAGTVVLWAGSASPIVHGAGYLTYFSYSTNHGVSWTGSGFNLAPSSVVAASHGCIWVPSLSLFVVVGYQASTTTARLLTSPNGITWTSQTLPAQLSGNKLTTITNNIPGGGNLIITDTAGNIATSTNATTWTYAGTKFSSPVIYLSSTGLYYQGGVFSADLVNWNVLPVRSGFGAYTSAAHCSDGTRIYTTGSSYNPLPYTTSTQFIVPNFGQNGLGSAPAYGAYHYIKT